MWCTYVQPQLLACTHTVAWHPPAASFELPVGLPAPRARLRPHGATSPDFILVFPFSCSCVSADGRASDSLIQRTRQPTAAASLGAPLCRLQLSRYRPVAVKCNLHALWLPFRAPACRHGRGAEQGSQAISLSTLSRPPDFRAVGASASPEPPRQRVSPICLCDHARRFAARELGGERASGTRPCGRAAHRSRRRAQGTAFGVRRHPVWEPGAPPLLCLHSSRGAPGRTMCRGPLVPTDTAPRALRAPPVARM